MRSEFDAVIVGGGHNGLIAAAYLAKAGRSVLVLERDDHFGGAAISAHAFEGHDARLSRYSYLVSLLPQRIIDDLGLRVQLIRRRYSSYTPVPGDPEKGLLVDSLDADATAESFRSIGEGSEFAGFSRLYADTTRLAQKLWPSVTEPLLTQSEARALVGDENLWARFIDQPLGETLDHYLSGDVSRGVALTDGLIGTFSSAYDGSLDQNRCFLYHVIGGKTGDWDVPRGGMGAVSGEMERVARSFGAELVSGADVRSIDPGSATRRARVLFDVNGTATEVFAEHVLANVSPWVLGQLIDEPLPDADRPMGAQVKVNLLLSRLPRLRDPDVSPEQAFGGTFHINETFNQLETAYREAKEGNVPTMLPCEIYCHSLSDPSILGPELQASGAATITVFGLHVPDSLITPENNDVMRDQLVGSVMRSLNSVLAEPIEDLLLIDAHGKPCIEGKTTLDLEHALNMTGGNIFHGLLSWPWVDDDADLSTPALRWGVATSHNRILVCGSGARRGGAVSGLGGHNAAMAILEQG